MRILFFTGKGGVGKTTVAAATALHCARRGIKTLLLSADSAHSVGDVLGVAVPADPAEVAEGLYAAHLDPQARFEDAWGVLRHRLAALFDQGGADPVTAEELTVLPGIEEVLALLQVREHARAGRFDAIVVDCGPSAETLRLLALPDALSWYLERMLPAQRRVARGTRPLAALLGAGASLPSDGLFDGVLALAEDLRSVRDVVADPGTSVRLVLTPESMVVAEARRTRTALALYGYRLDGAVINRLMAPGTGTGKWATSWQAAQREQLELIAQSFPDVPTATVAYRPREPIGAAELGEVAPSSAYISCSFGDTDARRSRCLTIPGETKCRAAISSSLIPPSRSTLNARN